MGRITTRGIGEVHATPSIVAATFTLQLTAEDPETVRNLLEALIDDLDSDLAEMRDARRVVRWDAPRVKVEHRWPTEDEGEASGIVHFADGEQTIRFLDRDAISTISSRYLGRGVTLKATTWELDPEAREEAESAARAKAVADAATRARDYSIACGGTAAPKLETMSELSDDVPCSVEATGIHVCIRSAIEATFAA